MAVRYRPLGPVGSFVEILVGGLLLRDALWADERYGATLVAVLSALGAVILAVGIVGLAVNIRTWIRSGSARP